MRHASGRPPPPLLLPLILCGKIRTAALFWEGMGVVGERWVGGGGEFEVAAAYPSADALPNQRDDVQGMSNTVSTVMGFRPRRSTTTAAFVFVKRFDESKELEGTSVVPLTTPVIFLVLPQRRGAVCVTNDTVPAGAFNL